ncbi:MAG TPA: helix-turn-helix domain-containing protein [Polyangiales bacterium]|nr:helix-turn-helix domain-containing protein [Polyangiales bacterium]
MTGLRYAVHAPAPPLAGLVDHLWSLSDAPSHSKERIIPSGTIELVINLEQDEIRIYESAGSNVPCTRLSGAVVSGAYSDAFVVDTQAHASIMGVHFHPGRAAALLGIPAGALADTHVELSDLWGRSAVDLRERLCAAPPSRRFGILERALVDVLPQAAHVRGEVDVALGRLGAPGVGVAQVAKDVELSHRRFSELFTEQVGMTPKRFSRIRRFQHALALATNGPSPNWSQVAFACGYYDQAHLCREWLEFTGSSPLEFLRLRSVLVKDNHLAEPEPRGSNFSNTARHAARTMRANERRKEA